jgi:hypothetical protein
MRNLARHLMPLWHRHLAASRHEADRGINDLLMHFSAVNLEVDALVALARAARSGTTAQPGDNGDAALRDYLLQASQRLRDAVDGALVAFQFQDRLSQMLGVVQDDIERFRTWVATDPVVTTDAHVQLWLERLQDSYTMQEQVAAHHQIPDAATSRGVDFF